MRTITITILTVALALAGAACDNSQGSDGEVLHLNGADITVKDMRAYMQFLIVLADDEQAGSAQASCKTLTGLSPDEAANAIGITLGAGGEPDPASLADWQAYGATLVPGQVADQDTGRRVIGMVLEECKRITQ